MKNKKKYVMAAVIGCMLAGFNFPAYAYASDGEDYITISVDAVDDNANLQYAIDSDDESAFTSSNEFTVPAGTSHTIYVKDVAGNITSQRYEPQDTRYSDDYEDEEEQRINIDLELGRQEEKEVYSPDEEGNLGTASVTERTKTDGSVDAEKVFYTFTTKEGEELYLVVDQGRGSDNVYLLDTVSLGDLRVLADGQTSTSADDDKEDNLLASLQGEDPDSELEDPVTTPPKKESTASRGVVILILALIGGGSYYYLKIYRNKKDEAMDAMDAMDMDEFEPEEDEDEEMEFDYNDSEKEQYLDRLMNEEEEDFYDQDPDAYATSHRDEDETDETETDLAEDDGEEDEDSFEDIEVDF